MEGREELESQIKADKTSSDARHGITQNIYTLMSSKEVNKTRKEEQIRYDE